MKIIFDRNSVNPPRVRAFLIIFLEIKNTLKDGKNMIDGQKRSNISTQSVSYVLKNVLELLF